MVTTSASRVCFELYFFHVTILNPSTYCLGSTHTWSETNLSSVSLTTAAIAFPMQVSEAVWTIFDIGNSNTSAVMVRLNLYHEAADRTTLREYTKPISCMRHCTKIAVILVEGKDSRDNEHM